MYAAGVCRIGDTQIRRLVVARLTTAEFVLLATGESPHRDIVLPDLSRPALDHLVGCFGDPEPNLVDERDPLSSATHAATMGHRSESRRWEMWVDLARVFDGLTYGDLRDADAAYG